MFNSLGMSNDFSVNIETTDNRGFTPEETAERCVNKLIGISNNAHPSIREQAHAYRKEMEKIIAIYMRQAIKSDRTTLYNEFKKQGHDDMAEILMKL